MKKSFFLIVLVSSLFSCSDKGTVTNNPFVPNYSYGQTQLENEKTATANRYLFCDTNLMVTKVFSEVYYNYCEPSLDQAAREHEYDLFFLTDIDVPWEKDDLRDKPEGRETVFSVFKQSLIDNNKPFITLSGDASLRLKKAVAIIDALTLALQKGHSSLEFVQMYLKSELKNCYF